MRKIKWVDSWRDMPKGKGIGCSTRGYSDPETDTIYAIKGITSQAEIEHEKYHRLKEHEGLPKDPKIFVRQELEAHKYAYDKIKAPRNILQSLRGIFNDLGSKAYDYDIDKHEAMAILKSELDRINPPKAWKNDFGKVESEFEKKYGNTKSISVKNNEESVEKKKPKNIKKSRDSNKPKHRVLPKTPRKSRIKRKPKVKRKRNPGDRYYFSHNLDGKTY